MTNEERQKILSDAADRALLEIKHTPGDLMGDEDFSRLCYIHAWLWSESHFEKPERVTLDPLETPAPVAPAAPEAPEEEMTPAPAVTDAPKLSKEEVRARLSELGDSCPDDKVIPGVLKSMGYQKLSNVPTERYAELLEKAEAAVKEVG